MWCRIFWVFSAVAALLIYRHASWDSRDAWAKTFQISAWTTGSSLLLFLCGARFYHSEIVADAGSRLTAFLRDPKAFLVEMKRRNREQNEDSTPSPEDRKKERRKKLKMVCMWTNFVLFGFVLSAGKTLFPYQGGFMKYGDLLLPLLVVIQSISRKIISFLFELILKRVPEVKQRKSKLVRICVGMLLSIPCFVVAWLIEALRLSNAAEITLPDGESIIKSTMSIFYLVPQFCILGLTEGLAQDGLDEFMIDMFPKSRKDYVSAINAFVLGLGNFGTVVSLKYADSLFTDVKNMPQDITIKNPYTTRVAKYFIIITIVASVNLCYYLVISILFYYRNKRTTGTSGIANSDVNKAGEEKRSQTADLEFNTVGGDHEISQSTGLDANSAREEDHYRSKKSNLDDTREEARDHGNPFKSLSDLLSACF